MWGFDFPKPFNGSCLSAASARSTVRVWVRVRVRERERVRKRLRGRVGEGGRDIERDSHTD